MPQSISENTEDDLTPDNLQFFDAFVDENMDEATAVAVLLEIQNESLDNEEVREVQDQGGKETSGSRIKAYKTLIKRLLLSNVTHDHLRDTIFSEWKGKQKPTDRELDAMMACMKTLKPYIPPSDAPRCILLQLPLVIVSNTVQRVAGYGAFQREVCPYVGPASIQALPLDAPVLYEAVSSPHETRKFNLLDRHSQSISSALWATVLKADTFGAFFDLRVIQDHCDSYGLKFDYRMMYLPNGLVRIQGVQKPGSHTFISYYDERQKKRRQGNGGTNNTKSKDQQLKKKTQLDAALIDKEEIVIKESTEKIKKILLEVRTARSRVAKARLLLNESKDDAHFKELVQLKRFRDECQMRLLEEKVKCQNARHKKWLLIHVSH
jgi:hypothetical protein